MSKFYHSLLFSLPITFAIVLLGYNELGIHYFNKTIAVFLIGLNVYIASICCFRLRVKLIQLVSTLAGVTAITFIIGINKVIPAIVDNVWLLVLAGVTVTAYIAGLILARCRILQLITSLGLFITLIILLVLEIYVDEVGVTCVIFLILLCLCSFIQNTWSKIGSTDNRLHILCISPFLLAAFIIMLLIPAPKRPYSWPITGKIYSFVSERISSLMLNLSLGGSDSADSSYTGFATNPSLKTSRKKNAKEIMEVSVNSNPNSNLYLKGVVFNNFDGSGWNDTTKTVRNEYLYDSIESAAAFIVSNDYKFQDFAELNTVNISYRHFSSKYIFSPNKLVLFNQEIAPKKTVKGTNFTYKRRKGINTSYKVSYLRLNNGKEFFWELLRNPPKITQESWRSALYMFNATNSDADFNELEVYHNDIRTNYLPETTLSDKAMTLLNGITENAHTDIDKLLCLEEYLSSLEYTLTPDVMPSSIKSDNEFIDYFLFEKPSGYCSHFATAFVIMARAMGIPARYVSGFCFDNVQETPIVYTSDKAHAWPEAYISGFGWMNFEPTPAFIASSRDSWGTFAEKQEQLRIDRTVQKEKYNEWAEAQNYSDSNVPDDSTAENVTKKNTPINVKNILLISLCIIGSILLLLILDIIFSIIKFSRMSEEKQALTLCKRNLRILKELNFTPDLQETYSEFKARVSRTLPKESTAFLGDYEKLIYAKNYDTASLLKSIEISNENLLNQLRQKKRLGFSLRRIMLTRIF